MKHAFAGLSLLALVTLGARVNAQCSSHATDAYSQCTHGIPNFRTVQEVGHDRVLYRGGQPTQEGWRYLHDVLGVTTVVKLNAGAESDGQANDQPAADIGIRVVVATMPPVDYGLSLRSVGQLIQGPTIEQAVHAVAALASAHGNVYLHCTHGRDRTGLNAALYRVFVDHWTPADARVEMLAAGYRSVNRGLERFWSELFERGTAEEQATRQRAFQLALEHEIAAMNPATATPPTP